MAACFGPAYLSAKTIDYLIVGQGLAGTLIGYRLECAGHSVHYIDAPEQTAASAVAAGIINPITGRRFVKSWRIDDLLPEARKLYAELERTLGVPIWHDIPLVRTLFNRGDQNDWLARSGDPGYDDYLDDDPALGGIPAITEPAFSYAGVRHSARVDVALLVERFRARLRGEQRISETALDYGDLSVGGTRISLVLGDRTRIYDRVIFCEGWRSRSNPWFGDLPYGGNKGEVLIVKTEAPLLDRLFKHRIFLVPQSDDTYWVGATSQNLWTDEGPTPDARKYLEDRLRELITVPYEIVDHRAAVRPTIRDRRPVIGVHPEHPTLWIFNGLGTKGASLAPLVSRWLLAALAGDAAVPGEVDLGRFGG
ncbi:glycine/D-amino acid oxidase-like deaminating enzyme [Neolewinella xylanilytica]|uniref:Glycine/D-amino acid oxidase-like deaminating enzyme n=1 Tax=Neolewinella xylanilytica TaxID=1514080 RepID=A0A2S6I4X7_9BACT|nr:FAD-dependent oxidoreductase [Neolewinella xylanilytica]PPK86223.1 glycine/D-amino acid oxidase-like deaminating enzyme [Neolewinella xylanilytica]